MRLTEELLDQMMENSYQNFHVKGFDYLCLFRTPSWTRKVYFFEGDITKLPEIVSPHDHRYNFRTSILLGSCSNSIYLENDEYGKVYQEFDWETPLNGGDGFKWVKETRLFERRRDFYVPGDTYFLRHHEMHTIRMHSDETILLLDQYTSLVGDTPTKTFHPEKEPPSLDGIYEKFTPDRLLERIEQLDRLTKGSLDVLLGVCPANKNP